MVKTLFLPGASGSASFWKPVAAHAGLEGVFFAWPGLGAEPPHPGIDGIDDLCAMVAKEMTDPVDIVAQSMGGLIAMKVALAKPMSVKRLVLAVTSGGVPVADLGGADWRSSFFTAFPHSARRIADPVEDLSERITGITVPTLLLWGDEDPISPVAVGDRLAGLLPNARLRVFVGAGHDLARTHAAEAAIEIKRHLSAESA